MHLHTLHEPGFSHGSYLRVTPHNQVNLELVSVLYGIAKIMPTVQKLWQKKKFCCYWQPQTRFKLTNKPHAIYARPPYS